MRRAFLKYVCSISILLWSASASLFAQSNLDATNIGHSIEHHQFSDHTSISDNQIFTNFDIKSSLSIDDKRIEVIETKAEEEIENVYSENDNFRKTYFIDVFVSLKDEQNLLQTSVKIALRSYFNTTSKSLYEKFCSFRI